VGWRACGLAGRVAEAGIQAWMHILDAEDVLMEERCAMPLSALLSSGERGRGKRGSRGAEGGLRGK